MTYQRTYCCSTCGRETTEYLEEYYSFGIYAGRYCNDKCWAGSGYRDAVDLDAEFDPAFAGERLEPLD
jgi:ribosomal protein L37AE/L43A